MIFYAGWPVENKNYLIYDADSSKKAILIVNIIVSAKMFATFLQECKQNRLGCHFQVAQL